ncbi:ribose-phosphate pyrophosphokinase, putative [Coccidioides posadasii C735 delta SOWgp]|uniref:Ribose-phosphate pyrophosphokinase 1 n=2 Tax=Coccidioides posadasii TaxID=199306 RepID=A0A0J6FN58_COCPO|nr:ribose-phosphate pyrophosphokinase, putative [Coccidioides posadasii C735 delta SOWgp]EER25513.1 ribose-phosphate pyrophosphokinase, putative [Coccidioides posadasii C735 delta SOWgp]KMM70885.1 ribose-phosphate pyrophosphokinase 1 [Coccidioides posadasii RMSCC 3488]|eukprot:XP_003067658.1 ribose-phosphate pyrophosphokinase, putative [Coccidioides posadasii C735 delta SOWgp]
MRGVQIFSGTSHPALTEAICERLGTVPAKCELRKFSNGETCVNIGVSVRNQDVFIVQSGSSKINDSVMELLIMISACKGGSAKSITAVLPYFPYSRQSKKKSHRGAITARMLANLLSIAGVDHVITVDLHASQMQGFFGKPVDNLFAESLIARWIRINVPRWHEAVVVTKNAGGSKRVTSLADALKLNFGIVTTDRRRQKYNHNSMTDSAIFFDSVDHNLANVRNAEFQPRNVSHRASLPTRPRPQDINLNSSSLPDPFIDAQPNTLATLPEESRTPQSGLGEAGHDDDDTTNEYTDERAREVVTARLVQGHLVDDDYPSANLSSTAASVSGFNVTVERTEIYDGASLDPTSESAVSTLSSFQPEHALGGSFDAAASSDEEDEKAQNSNHERTITLVGDVRDKTVFIVDDMIDRAGSWIAAAETVVKKGGANKVYCIATHGLFGENSLEQMERCDCIDYVVITNTFPIDPQRARRMKKLVVLDVSALLSESIRRHHYGESISSLFELRD